MTAADYSRQFGDRLWAHMHALRERSDDTADNLDQAAFYAACYWAWLKYSHGSAEIDLVTLAAKMAEGAQKLAWFFKAANEKYATDYPAQVGPHMTNTDSTPFMDDVAAVSLRENERGVHVGSGWDPHWHQPTDVYATFSDKDFLLGLNAAQTTLSGVAQLTGAKMRK